MDARGDYRIERPMKLALTLFALLPLSVLPAAASAQTTPAKPASTTSTTHHASASTSTAWPVVNPPGVPKITGVPHTMYSLKYIDIKIGTGEVAPPNKWYTVHYTGWFPDGKKFDSSVDRKEPFVFPYGAHRVIIGWDTGFEGMRVGGKRRLFVPYQLAYGTLGNPAHGMPAKANLVFDVEMLGFSDTPPAPKTPPVPPPSATPPAPPTPPVPHPEQPASAPATAPAAPTTPPAAVPPTSPKPATPPSGM
jgi:peptidylprolyl isomerase